LVGLDCPGDHLKQLTGTEWLKWLQRWWLLKRKAIGLSVGFEGVLAKHSTTQKGKEGSIPGCA